MQGLCSAPDGAVNPQVTGSFALGDASRLMLTGTRALSPAQGLREGELHWDSGISRQLVIAHYSHVHYYLLQ